MLNLGQPGPRSVQSSYDYLFHGKHAAISFNRGSLLNLKMHYPNFKGDWLKSTGRQVKPFFSCPHGLRSPFMKSAPESWQLYWKSRAALDEVSGDIPLFIPRQWDFDEPSHSPFCRCTSLTLTCSRARYYTGSCHLTEAKLALIQLPVHRKKYSSSNKPFNLSFLNVSSFFRPPGFRTMVLCIAWSLKPNWTNYFFCIFHPCDVSCDMTSLK